MIETATSLDYAVMKLILDEFKVRQKTRVAHRVAALRQNYVLLSDMPTGLVTESCQVN